MLRMSERLDQLWLASVRAAPDCTAVIDATTGQTYSRSALQQAAQSFRDATPADARLRGQRVTLASPNGPGWLAAFIALQQEGAIVVPLDPTEPAESRRAIGKAVGAAWACENGRLERLEERTPARRKDLCLVKLTSGSTGTPRALTFSQDQMIADGRQVCASMGIRPDDLNLGVIPFGHSYGLGNIVVPLLVQGTPVLAASSPLPHVLAGDCARWKPTVFPAVPTLLRALAATELAPESLQSLRLVISAGAPLTGEVAQAFAKRFGIRVHSFYGSSETGGITYDTAGEASLTARSVGTPMVGVTLSFGRAGRFHVASAAVIGKGRFSPSDRAKFNEYGELVLLGRAGRTAKIAGRRVDLSEIERILRSVPGVQDAYAMQHPTRVDALAAAVAGTMDAGSLRRDLRARTATWKIPERLLILADLPRTGRGKVDRRALQRLLSSEGSTTSCLT